MAAEASGMNDGPRLADLLASVSLVSDQGFALPAEESMRACLIATAVAGRLGLPGPERADVFYTSLLQHLGCTGFAHETAEVYADEMALNAAAASTDPNDLKDTLDTFIRAAIRDQPPLPAMRAIAYTLVRGGSFGRRFATARCEVGRETARRIGLPESVRRGLHEVAESWDGRGDPAGLRGEAISVPARLAQVGAVAARFDALGGPESAVEAVRRRAGRSLDPTAASAFVADASRILTEVGSTDPRARLLAVEPEPVMRIDGRDLTRIATAIADVADLKSTYTLGHSPGVVSLAAEAGARVNLPEVAQTDLRTAGLLHDVGRVGVSDGVWERPGPLTGAGWEQVRLHAYHSERILGRSDAFRPIAALAGRHHERLDGSGYHRGTGARDLPMDARILAAADAFQAMTQARAYRPAASPDESAERLTAEAAAGRLDAEAVRAVIAAAGVVAGRVRRPTPAGLTAREVEVLGLVARGLSNREIAAQLVVSPRTAEHHVQHIYGKIGVSSRAAAALFALEHDLLPAP
jgi:HD-GYP domain-containing protein (c-di-GMP phosphodiesterase class II)